jgi:hypothetical protein
MKVRCLGGPLHGEMQELPEGARFVQAAVPPGSAHYMTEYVPSLWWQNVTYEVRRLHIGSTTNVYVLVLRSYSEDALHRALADFIEKVER